MEKILPQPLPEILFGSSNSVFSRAINKALKEGKLRKLAPRIYTSRLDETPENIIARNRYQILGELFPGAVVSHRSALEGGAKEGIIFLTYKYTKKFSLPGLTVQLMKGPGVAPGDTQFLGKLFLASRARVYLENMQISRSRGGAQKTLSAGEIEERLEKLCQTHGSEELSHLRNQAKLLASSLSMTTEFKKLDQLIGAILGTQKASVLQTDYARARSQGEPYDKYRMELLTTLALALKSYSLERRAGKENSAEFVRNVAFFEAYFSNYIEGTKFLVEEGAEIVFKNKILSSRPEDSHDILGTFRIVENVTEMCRVPASSAEMVKLLRARHATLLESRHDKKPGFFKEEPNRFGNIVFVSPELILGTFKKAHALYQTLENGLPRAIFMMFLISEVHPFNDGNGRIARIMMNAELVALKQTRIIIPTVYREDYLSALRLFSRSGEVIPYIRMLDRAQKFTDQIDFSHYAVALKLLQECNAFLEPHEGQLKMLF